MKLASPRRTFSAVRVGRIRTGDCGVLLGTGDAATTSCLLLSMSFNADGAGFEFFDTISSSLVTKFACLGGSPLVAADAAASATSACVDGASGARGTARSGCRPASRITTIKMEAIFLGHRRTKTK